MPMQQQQPIDELPAGFVDDGLRQQFSVVPILQCVATFNYSLTHDTVNHETLGCYMFLSTGLWTSKGYNLGCYSDTQSQEWYTEHTFNISGLMYFSKAGEELSAEMWPCSRASCPGRK